MADERFEKGLRSVAAYIDKERHNYHTDEFTYDVLRRELLPLLEAAQETIEFYDAHGGPMANLRKEVSKWQL